MTAAHGDTRISLPRQKCRGLIEAWRGHGRPPKRSCVFPGRNAGASLKLERAAWHPEPLGRLPRQKCRGLIEAVPREPDPVPWTLVFPGRNAGASLKLVAIAFIIMALSVVFPGRNAGASLKPDGDLDGAFGGVAVFPGRNAGASLKHQIFSISCKKLQCLLRQKCRGLIEARPAG